MITNGKKPSTVIGKFDSLTLMQRPKLAAQTQLIDDGMGPLNVFRVDGTKLIELPKITFGSLFSGDVYIVTYQATVYQSKFIIFSKNFINVSYVYFFSSPTT